MRHKEEELTQVPPGSAEGTRITSPHSASPRVCPDGNKLLDIFSKHTSAAAHVRSKGRKAVLSGCR